MYIFCSLCIYPNIGKWLAVLLTLAILCDSHVLRLSIAMLSLVDLEALQLSFHVLFGIAKSPDSPLRLTLIIIIEIYFVFHRFACNGRLYLAIYC